MIEAERRLVLTYAPSVEARAALAALFALDDKLAETLRTTSEPMLGQIRMQWWHDALNRLDSAPPPAEPVLQGIARDVLREGISGASVAGVVDGWQMLLQTELDDAALHEYAERGRRLFEVAGLAAGVDGADLVAKAGEGWALADLSGKLSDPGEAAAARRIAEGLLVEACSARWSRTGRALGAMVHLARLELDGVPVGSPKRTLRALWHRMTGR
ncbi:squalene/phytoene synthase family protein [Sphingomonas sp.]|uniref:squalene/phytoene synthase family protein n=1 Tax=Sphingomonas sp. TaxID=28214 RepID=UPI002E119649|nr:squalene/phytoene synthase family protein [Sphingomonas sp.]HEV7289926.1 squalene/phytoene synthase family protein [Sphingomonas sp.]